MRRQHKRHRVDLPGPFDAARIAMNVVSDTLLVDEAADVSPRRLVQPDPVCRVRNRGSEDGFTGGGEELSMPRSGW
jgi:hypothetical protein